MTLKIMTMNLNYYVPKHGEWPARRDLVQQAIEAAGPDILALQAVRRDPLVEAGLDAAAQLTELLPDYRYHIFTPALADQHGGAEGSAILSRLPVALADHLELTIIPGLDDRSPRVLMHARFDRDGGPLHLYNAHFSWVEEQARLNLDETLPYLRAYSGPAVLVGDMNNPPGSELHRRLDETGWTDAWETLHPGEDGFTFESNAPSLRIDYIWVNEALKSAVQEITMVAGEAGSSGARASDHLGLVATLDV